MSLDKETELVKHLTTSNHKFMVNLYRVLATNDENVFFSPFSIYVALVLTYLGSKGETAAELEEHLALPQKREHLLEGMRLLLNNLKHPELNTATEMFVEQTYKVRASYKEDAKKFMNSKSRLVDFITAADQATRIINSWVSSQTNKKINDLIPPGTLDGTTRLVLVNAIHFKGKWLTAFKQTNTRKENFFTSKDTFKEVDMMHLTEQLRYKQEDTFKVLELPYKNRNFKMIILLPNEIDGLPSLEQKIPKLNIGDILKDKKRKVEVRVSLPRFKFEKYFDLNAALQKLGITAIFDESKADFTGIHQPSELPLVVSKVLQKAFVEVNEEGTEAAAATGRPYRGTRSKSDFSSSTHDSYMLKMISQIHFGLGTNLPVYTIVFGSFNLVQNCCTLREYVVWYKNACTISEMYNFGVGITMTLCCSMPIVYDFTVNHPFIFAILFNEVTLFIGKQLSITV